MKSATSWKRKMRTWKTKMSNIGNLCFVFLLLSQLFSWAGLRCFWPQPTLFRFPNNIKTQNERMSRIQVSWKPKITYLPIWASGLFHQFWSSFLGWFVFLSCFLVALTSLGVVRTELGRKWKIIVFFFFEKSAQNWYIVYFDWKRVSDVGEAMASWRKVCCCCYLQSVEFILYFAQ